MVYEDPVVFWALASGALAALIYALFHSWRDGTGWFRSLIKMASLAPLALVWLAHTGAAPFGLTLMAVGLAFGVVGDFLLSRPAERAFLGGMIAFAAGHLAYAVALVLRGAELGFPAFSMTAVLASALLAGLVLSTEVWLAPRTGALRWPVRAYVGVIAIMALVVIWLPPGPGSDLLGWGAFLFLLSDLLLAVRLFVTRNPVSSAVLGAVLWPAYVMGQVLIAGGSLLFWGHAAG